MKAFINKYYYKLFLLSFSLLTIIETIIFLFKESNYFAFFYLILNYLILFFILTLNFKNSNIKIRISKNIIIIVLGFFSSFILYSFLCKVFNYTDNSKEYIKSILISLKVLKPLLYLSLGLVSYMEIKA